MSERERLRERESESEEKIWDLRLTSDLKSAFLEMVRLLEPYQVDYKAVKEVKEQT